VLDSLSDSNSAERALAFLDTYSVVNSDGSIRTKVFRKATHTDQYRNFNSNHPLEHKRGVVRTLLHRADTVVSDNIDKQSENIKEVMSWNDYPNWVFDNANSPGSSSDKINDTVETVNTPNPTVRPRQIPIVIPYVKGTSEQLHRVMKAYNVPVYFNPTNTLRQLLVRPKDPISKERVVGPVYHIKCESCNANYVGETERSLKARFMEHRRPSTASSEVSKHIHTDNPDHGIELHNTKILAVEPRWFERGVKEAIHIELEKPTLNRDKGRYNLPHPPRTSERGAGARLSPLTGFHDDVDNI